MDWPFCNQFFPGIRPKMNLNGVNKTAAANSLSRTREWLYRLLPLTIGGGLLALILSSTDLTRLARVLTQVQWRWYVLAQLMVCASLLLITKRWRFDLSLLK